MTYDFSPDELKICLDYVNNENKDDGTIDFSVISRMMTLCAAIQRKATSELKMARQENARLRHNLERYETRETNRFESGHFECIGVAHCGVLSTTAAKAFLYVLQVTWPGIMKESNSQKLMRKFMILFYDLYANCLYRLKGRMCIDIPKAYGYKDESGKQIYLGPWFHPVEKVLKPYFTNHQAIDSEEFNKVQEKMPELANLMWGIAKKRGGASVHELWKWIADSEPIRVAHPDNNEGKWGAFLDDGLIYKWKTGKNFSPLA